MQKYHSISTCKILRHNPIFNQRLADIAFFRSQPELQHGEIGAVVIDGEATLKRLKKVDEHVILEPENSEYKPILLKPNSDIHIAGKLVAVLNTNRF